ncbi:MAG: histidine kinase, partial [Bacteroidota bacterium]
VNFPENQASPFRNYLHDPNLKAGEFGHVMRGFTADDDGNVYANKDTKQPHWFRINQNDLSLDTLLMLDNAGKVVDHFGCGTNMINHQGDIYGSSCYLGSTDTAHVYRFAPTTGQWTQWSLPETDQKIRWMMPGRTTTELLLITEGTKEKKGNLFYFTPVTGTFEKVLPAGPAYTIDDYTKEAVQDSIRNCFWIGTTAGLYRFDPKTDSLTQYTFPDGRSTAISAIIVQPDGQLFLGTFDTGLQIFDPKTGSFKVAGGIPEDGDPLSQASNFLPLMSNDISSIAITAKDEMLIPTFNGLVFRSDDNTSVFTAIDGLPSNEFNTPSLFQNPNDQRWYAGGINGFTSFNTADLARDTSPYEVIFLRSRFLDEDIGYEKTEPLNPYPTERLVISPSVAYFSLEYTLPDYSNRNPPRYETKLVGLDKNWRTPETKPSVRYTQLAPGTYTFQVRSIDGSGRTTGEPHELEIYVEKPWYQTTLFYALVLLSIIGFITAYVRRREERLRDSYRAKRRVQQLELRALRQQLNPHFISNAMNAIRDFVYEARPEQAAVYLNDFTRLMRLFLEVSRERFTTIKDEVELLERYVRLEQLRFKGKFDYSISVSPDIEVGMDEVPSLLLQPIVENAIN